MQEGLFFLFCFEEFCGHDAKALFCVIEFFADFLVGESDGEVML